MPPKQSMKKIMPTNNRFNCLYCKHPIEKHTALLGAPGGLKCPKLEQCKTFTEGCYNHPQCLETLKDKPKQSNYCNPI